MVTKQLGPGMFQQFQTQECEQCSNVKYARESETLQVTLEPGMQDKEVNNHTQKKQKYVPAYARCVWRKSCLSRLARFLS